MNINPILTKKLDESRWLDSSKQCYDVLYTVARCFQVKKIVEIGTYEGSSAIALCQAVRDNDMIPEMYCVDAYLHAGQDISSHKEICVENLRAAGLSRYTTVIHGESAKELPKLFERIGKVDLCFIDGDHSPEGVKRDYLLCRDHSDLLLFHDVTSWRQEDFLNCLEKEGWQITIFPTRFVEGDNHSVGIALAKRKGK